MTATLPLYHSEKQSEREIKKMRHFLLLSVLWEGGGGTFKSRKVDGAMTHPLREGGGTLARQIIRIKDGCLILPRVGATTKRRAYFFYVTSR